MAKVVIKQKRIKPVQEDVDLAEIVANFHTAMKEISETVVDRSTEIEAIKLALVCRQHVLFEGLHGIAKSELADHTSKRVAGASFFKKQMMKGTQPEEIFGPLDSKRYREFAEWHFNTKGYLPTAHIGFIDEVYRASDMLLPSMMLLFNEREFINGTVVEKCPLMTVIGTTNFITETKEMAPFNDRWLMTVKVQPLTSMSNIGKMLRKFAIRDDEDAEITTISLEDLMALQKAARHLPVGEDVLDLYNELVDGYRNRRKGHYISDRRICQALRLAQAGTLLANPNAEETEIGQLQTAVYGLAMGNEKEQVSAFTEAAEQSIGKWEKYKQETANMADMLKFSAEARAAFDPKMAKPQAIKLHGKVKTVLSGISNMPAQDQPQSPKNQDSMRRVTKDLTDLLTDLSALVK